MNDAAAEFGASSAPDATSNSPPEPASRAPSAGTLLQLARESAGMSRADVAGHLKFSVKQIEAIETDNYPVLGGKTFVRGLVRTCAKLFNVDPGPILAALDASALPPEINQVAEDPKGIPFPSAAPVVSPVLRYIVISLGVIAGGILLLYLWHGDELFSGPMASAPQPRPAPAVRAEERAPVATTVVLAPTVVDTPAPEAERAPAANPPSAPKSARASGDKSAEKTGEPNAVTASTTPASTPTPGGGAGRRILMSFERDAWVEVRDAGGRILFSQMNLAGTQQVIEGRAPFELVIGNAPFVNVKYRDATVDLKPHTKADVARLSLK